MMLLSSEKLNLSNSGESSTSMDEQLLENVKPNLISLTSSGSYSSHFYSGMGNLSGQVNTHKMDELQNEEEFEISLKDLETSLDSFTVILEEPVKDSGNNESVVAANSLLQGDDVEHVHPSSGTESKHSVTAMDLLEQCSKVSVDQTNVEQTETKKHRYLKRMWSSAQDLSNLPYSSHKNESEFTFLMHNPCQSSTTISSVPKSKDSGLPRSLSCLSLVSGVKPYDHVQSKVREYISHIKKAETQRKKNVEMEILCKKNENQKSPICSIQQETEEDLRHVICTLQQELNDKNNIISQIQENYDVLLMKYADAENKIDRLRFKVMDSSVEEIRSHRTQEDFAMWSDVRNRSSSITQPHSLRSGFQSDRSQFRKSLFQNSLHSGCNSMPFTADIRQVNQETSARKLRNEVNNSPKSEPNTNVLMLAKKEQEEITFPPLAVSTPNHSFNKSTVTKPPSGGFQCTNSEKSVEYEGHEDDISLTCTGNLLTKSEEENFLSDEICLEPHTPDNMPLKSSEDFVREDIRGSETNICKIISDRLRKKDMPSFLSKDFSINEDFKTTSSETSILKVKMWQESLPPLEQREPSCYDVPRSSFKNLKRENFSTNHSTKGKKKSDRPAVKCYSTDGLGLEEKKCSQILSCKENLPNFINKDISTPYLERNQDCKFEEPSFTKRQFLKCFIKNFHLSHMRSCKSEPDLRLFMCKTDEDLEVKGELGNIEKLNSQLTHRNSSAQNPKLKFAPETSCNIGPLEIEPCYCWDKNILDTHNKLLDTQNKLQHKHNRYYAVTQDSSASEHTIPRLRIGNLIDTNTGNLHTNMCAVSVRNSNMPSFIYSPSTSVSSTAVFSGCKCDITENNLTPLDDSSTSYKIIQRTLPNRAASANCSIGQQYRALHNTQCSLSTKGGCRNACYTEHMCCHKNMGEEITHNLRTSDYVRNDLCCNCSKCSVSKHSCGVNTDNRDVLHLRSSRQMLGKTSETSFSCVNTEKEDLARSSSHPVAFSCNGEVQCQRKMCRDTFNLTDSTNKSQNDTSKQATSTENEHAQAKLSSEQCLLDFTSATEQDIHDLAQCFEEVKKIANLLKGQSESIIKVVSASLADCMEKGDTVINVSDLAEDLC